MPPTRSSYLYLTLFFLLLSAAIIYIFFQINQQAPSIPPDITPKPTILEPTPNPTLSPPTPLQADSTIIPTIPLPTRIPDFINYENPTDGFSVVYSSTRRLYPDTESSGNRYTFYLPAGNIAVHTGLQWSWSYPERQFSSDFIISGQPTFRYDIAKQTIVDIQRDDHKYTIQCVHQGLDSLKKECDQFIKDFKLL